MLSLNVGEHASVQRFSRAETLYDEVLMLPYGNTPIFESRDLYLMVSH